MGNREVVVQLRLSRRLVAVASVILALALGVAAVGTVFAQSTTTINGCYTNKTGALRVVTSSPPACKSGETAISWNQQGPQGVKGDSGQPGTNGTNDVDGQDGKTILNGSGAPAASLGRVGDYYIDNQADAIYGPKTANGWGSPTSLVGSPGTGGNADTLDNLDSTDFLRTNGKAADADLLDGQNSTAFASANHNHDSSYIQQSPASAENASINITGTMRTSGMIRTGSESGTSQLPIVSGGNYDGLVVRRIVSTNYIAGQVLARTDQLRLERDGTFGGLRIAWNAGASVFNSVNCMGINSSGGAVNRYTGAGGESADGTAQIFTDAQNVVYATCSFGNSFDVQHVTRVTLQRLRDDTYWVGTVISSYNQ